MTDTGEPAAATAGSKRRVGRLIGVVIALAISGLCLVLFLRGTDWPRVIQAIRQAHFGWVAMSFAMVWLSVVFRAFRWRVLLYDIKPVAVLRLYNFSMIGFLGNGLLPARLGEIARVVLLAARERIPFLALLATVVSERLLDLGVVGMLMITVLTVFPFPAETIQLPGLADPVPIATLLRQAGVTIGIGFVGMMSVVFLAVFAPRLIDRLIHATVGRVAPHLAARVTALLASFRTGLEVFRRPERAVPSLLWTLLVWGAIIVSDGCILPAFGVDAGLLGAVLLVAALAVCVALPQAPGYLGVFQLGVTIVLVKCFGTDESTAKAAAIVLWLVQLWGIVMLGFVSLAAEGVAFTEIDSAGRGATGVGDGGTVESEG